MSENKDTTTVQEVEMNLDELLGTPGAENIMVAETKKEEKPSIFSRKDADLSFLDNPEENEESSEGETAGAEGSFKPKKTAEQASAEIDSIINETAEAEENEGPTKKGGRPNGLVELTNKLIQKGLIVPFEDNDDIEKYTVKDFEELYEANEHERVTKLQEQVSSEFFDALPNELQVAAHYVANGGKDLKSLFRSLAAAEEIKSLDTSDENSQEQIVRSYLHATNFGDADEIEEEIEAWKDRDELEAKAKKFKPKLDAMQEQVVARQLEQQEHLRKQQQKQAQLYTDNIYRVLEPGELNGLKLDKKTQSQLFSGLTQANYPSMSGKPTNLLGHLLEKYQYVEPNHGLIAKALWLLSDEQGFEARVREIGKKEATEKTVRALKTEQSNKLTSGMSNDTSESKVKKQSSGIARPSQNFFKR